MNPFDLLESVLAVIEKRLKEDINVNAVAEEFDLSERHLQRLFKFAFNQTIGSYIRSRKLTASIDDLLNTNLTVLNIALEYGFEYEPSYIRSFQREYGITPGDLRKTGKILKITPPLQLFNSQKYPNGVMFGPEIVVVPQFHVVGKKYKIPFRDGITLPQSLGKQFFFKERRHILNAVNPDVLVFVTSEAESGADYHYSMPSVRVKALEHIPEGFDAYTFPTSLCANFRFINSTDNEFNLHIADEMFKAINDYMDSEDQKYFLERRKIDIAISDLSNNYEKFKFDQVEWLSPVIAKTSLKIPPLSPSGIKKVYRQELPALRFVGKKYGEPPQPKDVLNLLDNWQLDGWFDIIEKQAAIDYKTFFEGSAMSEWTRAYISLIRKKDGVIEHWMGMFMPEDAKVLQGYEAVDFPKMTIAVCRVYGKRDEIVNYETECRKKLTEEGFAINDAKWYFRRFNWHRFYEEDVYGKRLLDYCYPIM